MDHMRASEAQRLLFDYTQRLFKARPASIKKIPLNHSFSKEARKGMVDMSKDLEHGFDRLSPGAQRYVYECLTLALIYFSGLDPTMPLPALEGFDDSLPDDEKLALLLRYGIAAMTLPFQLSH